MHVEVRQAAFDPWREVAAYQASASTLVGKVGATAVFVGSMRDFNQGHQVAAMTLEHYPGMTDKHLARIAAHACREWDLLDALVLHRCGALVPNEPIVLVAAWSPHRHAALEACRYMIDELKT